MIYLTDYSVAFGLNFHFFISSNCEHISIFSTKSSPKCFCHILFYLLCVTNMSIRFIFTSNNSSIYLICTLTAEVFAGLCWCEDDIKSNSLFFNTDVCFNVGRISTPRSPVFPSVLQRSLVPIQIFYSWWLESSTRHIPHIFCFRISILFGIFLSFHFPPSSAEW